MVLVVSLSEMSKRSFALLPDQLTALMCGNLRDIRMTQGLPGI